MHILITYGGTREPIDPVRFIGNRSSGRMGKALAVAARRIDGVNVSVLDAAAGSASELAVRIEDLFETVNVLIMAAAVADYTPEYVELDKIKKQKEEFNIKLVPTEDILAELGKKKVKQYLVGFCLESNNLEEEARRKLVDKNLDMVVANHVSAIGVENSQVMIITKNNLVVLPILPKEESAKQIIERILDELL